jgi:hypothetical protein
LNVKLPKGDIMLVNDNLASNQNTAQSYDIADYIRGIATDLERLSQQSGMEGIAACLRATVCEARRYKNDERLLKLGVTPDRRLG